MPADPHTAGAKNATVVIHAEQPMGHVHAPFRETIVVTHVLHALAVGERLQLAMTVGHTHGADVVAFGEEQLKRQAAILPQTLAVGLDFHVFADFGRAGGQQFGHARDLHEAEAAGAHIINTFKVTERRDFDPGVGGDFQNGRPFLGADLFSING